MSDYIECTQCGGDIEETGIQYRGKFFCSDDCCEQYEQDFLDKDEPLIDELAADDADDDDDLGDIENIGFEDNDDEEDLLDDDYNIKPEDF